MSIQLEEMKWFRAFNIAIDDAVDYAKVAKILVDGPEGYPNETWPNGKECKTWTSEKDLGILGPNVYAYLGRSCPDFGPFACAYPQKLPFTDEAKVSPFDSGSLVHHAPSTAGADPKRKLLRTEIIQSFSWAYVRFGFESNIYPSQNPHFLKMYLGDTVTEWEGPHQVWKTGPASQIWRVSPDTNSWRYHTWELRVFEKIQHSKVPDFFWYVKNDHLKGISDALFKLVGSAQAKTVLSRRKNCGDLEEFVSSLNSSDEKDLLA